MLIEMKTVKSACVLGLLLWATAGCVRSQFQPIQQATTMNAPADSAAVTVFLLERDLPTSMERLGTIAVRVNQTTPNFHQILLGELQKVARQQGANGAYRLQHGTYELDRVGVVSYLLFRYRK